MADRNEWVSLGEAAEILGVHPSTIRHWADDGDLPSHRTPGGHRRFLRQDLMQWSSARTREASGAEAQLMLQNALGRARIEITDGGLHGVAWHEQFDEAARKAHRHLGRHLLEILTRYLADPADEERPLSEVRALGEEYAQMSIAQGLGLSDSVRAFLFFRDLVLDSVIQLADMLSLHTPLDWGNRMQQVNLLTDALLLTLIETYDDLKP